MQDSQRHVVDASLGRAPVSPLLRPACVVSLLSHLALLECEVLVILGLDAGMHLVSQHRLLGTAHGVRAQPRELLGPVLAAGAVALVAVHNHPSGVPQPSADDLAFTRRLGLASELCGVSLLDHVIIASGGWCSLRAEDCLRNGRRDAAAAVQAWRWP